MNDRTSKRIRAGHVVVVLAVIAALMATVHILVNGIDLNAVVGAIHGS